MKHYESNFPKYSVYHIICIPALIVQVQQQNFNKIFYQKVDF